MSTFTPSKAMSAQSFDPSKLHTYSNAAAGQ
jgi:hypothetical protein